nr:hypothetical protein [Tanacetum cinerariifolium]
MWNNSQRVNHKNHSNAKRNNVPRAALTVNAARPINVVHPKRTMNAVNKESYFSKQAHSFVQRPNKNLTTLKNSYANKKVKTVWVKKLNTAKPKVAVNAAKAKAKHKAVKGKRGNAVKASACWTDPTGLEELFNEPKTKKSKDKSNDVEPESVRKGSDSSIIEDWVSDDEEENVKKKEVKPSINRINFVKATTDNSHRDS